MSELVQWFGDALSGGCCIRSCQPNCLSSCLSLSAFACRSADYLSERSVFAKANQKANGIIISFRQRHRRACSQANDDLFAEQHGFGKSSGVEMRVSLLFKPALN